MKNKFEVGQKVRVKKHKERPSYFNPNGKMDHLMGMVVTIKRRSMGDEQYSYIVYDDKYKVDWAFKESDLEPINETIVIYRKDQEVIALDKTTGNKAIARCCPEDKFDFHYGAALALGRLIGEKKQEEKPKYFSGLVQIIKKKPFKIQRGNITIGKIYEVKNGVLIDDIGCKTLAYLTIEHMSKGIGFELKEIKEVKRPAKVGEFVKVVSKNDSNMNEYQNGDILKIVNSNFYGDYYKNESGKYLYRCEYVVLEGYEESDFVKKFKDEIKVGDTVEVINLGGVYTTYETWTGLEGYKQNFVVEKKPCKSTKYKVLRIEKHNKARDLLALIQNPETTQVFIIDIDCIKKA